MRAGATEAKIAEVPTALTSELFDEREHFAVAPQHTSEVAAQPSR